MGVGTDVDEVRALDQAGVHGERHPAGAFEPIDPLADDVAVAGVDDGAGEVRHHQAHDDVVERGVGRVADVDDQLLVGLEVVALVVAGAADRDLVDLELLRDGVPVLEDGALWEALAEEVLAEGEDGRVRVGDGERHASFEDHDAVARPAHEVRGVGHEHDRSALLLEGPDAFEALPLERFVADGEDLVDQQHVGLDVDRHREAETDVHARRVVLHLLIDELLELGERDDVVEARSMSRLVSPRIEPLRNTFSRPVRSGWKPAPSSRSDATRPRTRITPVVGVRIPPTHLSSVDLPEPLWPSNPTVSPIGHLEVDVAGAPRSPCGRAWVDGGGPAVPSTRTDGPG